MKTLKHIGVVACVAALAVPAGVLAKGPTGNHGNQGGQHGNSNKNNPNHVSKRCKHQPMVGFTLGGTLDPSSTASNIVVDVTHANKFAKQWLAGAKMYTVPSGATVRYNGPNPFTTPGANLSQYKVQVIGKVMKLKNGCTSSNSPAPTVRKVIVNAPDQSGSNLQSGSNVSGSNLQS